jgi:hypothetical protein
MFTQPSRQRNISSILQGDGDHLVNTRNSNKLASKLPVEKLETARNGLYYMGATLYNKLPITTRSIEILDAFKKSIKEFSFNYIRLFNLITAATIITNFVS